MLEENTTEQESQLTLKQELLRLVKELEKTDIDLKSTPVLFKWSYPELDNIMFELIVSDIENDVEFDSVEEVEAAVTVH